MEATFWYLKSVYVSSLYPLPYIYVAPGPGEGIESSINITLGLISRAILELSVNIWLGVATLYRSKQEFIETEIDL